MVSYAFSLLLAFFAGALLDMVSVILFSGIFL
jgi:hypothetical protein